MQVNANLFFAKKVEVTTSYFDIVILLYYTLSDYICKLANCAFFVLCGVNYCPNEY